MKIKIGKYTYRKASDVKKVLGTKPRNEKEVRLFYFIIGIYSCRFLGLVRYRTKSGFDSDSINVE